MSTNCEMKVTGKILTITIDLSKKQGPSASGKTEIIATTSGAAKVKGPSGDVSVGLNVYCARG